MRTTITLDDQLGKRIKEHALSSNRSFKEVVNELLRVGYETSVRGGAAKPYRLEPKSLGKVAADVDLVRALALSDALEDEEIVEMLKRGS